MVATRSHASRWGQYAALGIAVAFLVGSAQGQTNSQAVARPAQPPAQSKAVAPAPLPPRISVYKPTCEPAKTREDAEFCEERKSAEAETKSAHWAVMQFWASVTGVLFVVLTLYFTKQAADAALIAAIAAEKALSDLERPWLHYAEAHIQRRDHEEIKRGESPFPNLYFVNPILRNAGRMLAIIESVEFQFVPAHEAPKTPDYSNMQSLNHPIFVQPGELTPREQRDGSISPVGPGRSDGRDFVFYGRVKYKGLTTTGHVTGFAITIWSIAPVSTSFGGEAYNYHT